MRLRVNDQGTQLERGKLVGVVACYVQEPRSELAVPGETGDVVGGEISEGEFGQEERISGGGRDTGHDGGGEGSWGIDGRMWWGGELGDTAHDGCGEGSWGID